MAQLGHPQPGFPVLEALDGGQVRAGDQEVRLAGDAHAHNFPAGGTLALVLQDCAQLHQGVGAQGAGAAVVQAVVQGDQGEGAGAGGAVDAGQRHVLRRRSG